MVDTADHPIDLRLLDRKAVPPPGAAAAAQALAEAFMLYVCGAGRIRLRCIDQLCRMATHADPMVSRAGMQALYGTVIEGLSDDFSERGVRVCNLVLLRILAFMAGLPEGRETAALLARFGITGPAALLPRYERLRLAARLAPATREGARKAFVLSRVSAGADVAITSVLVQRLLAALPRAEIVLVGPSHLGEFFSHSPRLRWLRLEYRRHGSLCDRFAVWPRLLELIDREAKETAADQVLLFDPDSRLSQLGLLPLVEEQQTRYFSSRTNPCADHQPSLPELTNLWLDRVLAEEQPVAPGLFLPPAMTAAARQCCDRLRQEGARTIVVVNLGVGNNPGKRLGDSFERELLTALLEARGNTVIFLDTGGDSEEKERIRALLAFAGEQGVATGFLEQEEMAHWEPPLAHGLIGFHGTLGALASLISQADVFCGYDSCGQHLSGALRTPAVIVFAGAPNPRFFARWRSPAPTTATIRVDVPPASARARAELIETIVSRLHRMARREWAIITEKEKS